MKAIDRIIWHSDKSLPLLVLFFLCSPLLLLCWLPLRVVDTVRGKVRMR